MDLHPIPALEEEVECARGEYNSERGGYKDDREDVSFLELES